MTGNKVYEKLAAMTPEERETVCYSHPWPLSGLKDLINDLMEFRNFDRKKTERLLKNDKKLMELLEEAVDCDNAREYANDEVDDYLRNKLETLLGKPVKQEKK